MDKSWSEHQRHWARHFTAVPKGFCRIFVLKLIKEKAMSGAELMNEIEGRTQGQWRPSPGSIYPILKWLSDKELVSIESITAGEKRYLLTDKGREFLDEAGRLKEEILAKLHGQKTIINEMFHDNSADPVDIMLEDIHLLANAKKENHENDVKKILNDTKKWLEGI